MNLKACYIFLFALLLSQVKSQDNKFIGVELLDFQFDVCLPTYNIKETNSQPLLYTLNSYSNVMLCINGFNELNYNKFIESQKKLLSNLHNSDLTKIQKNNVELDIYLHLFLISALASDNWNSIKSIYNYNYCYNKVSKNNLSLKHAAIHAIIFIKAVEYYPPVKWLLQEHFTIEEAYVFLIEYKGNNPEMFNYYEALCLEQFISIFIDKSYKFDLNVHDLRFEANRFLQIMLLQSRKQNTIAIKMMEEYEDYKTSQFYYFKYLYGCGLLYELDKRAKIYFHKYISESTSDLYKIDAYKKLSWIHCLTNETNTFKFEEEKLGAFKYRTSIDDYALKELKEQDKINCELIKSRLLFDGGNYSKSYETLKKIKIKTLSNKEVRECNYRLAENSIHLDSIKQAEFHFNKLRNLSAGGAKEYYLPKLSKDLAVHYFNTYEYNKAMYYVTLGLNYSHYPYEVNIRKELEDVEIKLKMLNY